MIVKGTKQLGSFKRGINIYVPKRKSATPPVPAVIPVATTNAILLNRNGVLGTGTNYAWNSSNLANLIRDEYTNPIASVTLTKRGASSVEEVIFFASTDGNEVILYCIPNATYSLNVGDTKIFLGKTGSTSGYIQANSQTIPANTWFAAFISSYYGENYGNDPVYIASNPSTNFTVIPQTGWTAQTAETIVAVP